MTWYAAHCLGVAFGVGQSEDEARANAASLLRRHYNGTPENVDEALAELQIHPITEEMVAVLQEDPEAEVVLKEAKDGTKKLVLS